jgi:dipeptidyl aminopeptidase/acylaminoacyl peptidase
VCYNARSVRRKLALFILVGLLGIVAAILAAWYLLRPGPQEAATLFAEQGEMTVQRGGAALSLQAPGTLEVGSGDRIRTSPTSRALLVLSPKTSAALESDCEVVLLHVPPAGAESLAPRLEVQKGKISLQVQEWPGVENRLEVLTPAATVTLTSGRCWVRVSGGGESVVEVSEGEAQVLAKDTTVEVSSGEYSSVMPGRAPAVPRPVVARVLFVSERTGNPDIWLLDEQGREHQLTFDAHADLMPAWSPDGARIAFESFRDGNGEIYVTDADGSNLVNLTGNPADDRAPSWSPDGERIAFESERDGATDIYTMNADGTEQTRMTFGPGLCFAPQWEWGGSGIVFSRIEGDTNGDGLLDRRDMAAFFTLPADGGSPTFFWGTGEIYDQMMFPWGHRAVR